jgi:dephospho-CoA kinase
VPADPTWAEQAGRILARIRTACGHRVTRVDHIGSTAVPGLAAENVIDVQITVESLTVADELTDQLLGAGYPRIDDVAADVPEPDVRSTAEEFDHTDDAALWQKRFHAAADPGRPANVHVRVDGWPNQQFALLFVDWLTANPDTSCDVEDAYRRSWEWADAVGWHP